MGTLAGAAGAVGVRTLLGIDPGSVRMGYGVIRVDGERLEYVEAGVLVAPGGWSKYARLAELGRDIDKLLDEHQPDAVGLEAGFVKGQQGALTSGAARGVAGYLAARRGLEVTEFAPATVKKAVTGHGGAEKEAVADVVRVLLGLKRAPELDAGDALGVAIALARTPRATGKKRKAA